MTTATSRKDRRVLAAKTAKIYGIKGQESVDLHEAYNALARNEIGKAVQLALPITKSHPANRHAWIVMGGAALTQREGKTAKAFFGQALQARSDDPVALTGMSKAHLLSAEVEESVATARLAFEAGAEERGLVTMYMDLMSRLGRRLAAVDVLSPVVEKLNDAELCHTLGNMLLDADEPGKAARWYHAAYALDPKPEAHRIGHLRALLVECRFDEAEPFAQDLLQSAEDHDGVVNIYLLMLRVTGRRDEAEKLIQDTEFATPEGYAQALGLMANIHQDRGNYDAAGDSYQEAIHVTGHGGRLAKAYGVFLFRDGAYGEGAPHFAERFDQPIPESTSRLRVGAKEGSTTLRLEPALADRTVQLDPLIQPEGDVIDAALQSRQLRYQRHVVAPLTGRGHGEDDAMRRADMLHVLVAQGRVEPGDIAQNVLAVHRHMVDLAHRTATRAETLRAVGIARRQIPRRLVARNIPENLVLMARGIHVAIGAPAAGIGLDPADAVSRGLDLRDGEVKLFLALGPPADSLDRSDRAFLQLKAVEVMLAPAAQEIRSILLARDFQADDIPVAGQRFLQFRGGDHKVGHLGQQSASHGFLRQ